ncbi:GAF domain-containing protein (plasmid) [Microvirga sp. RSM25]|uniref:GAF domain-containing protein n=1 Tax=Microvirga sp. RSM25 TaxID=3273802 RepID=UPI00384C1D7A
MSVEAFSEAWEVHNGQQAQSEAAGKEAEGSGDVHAEHLAHLFLCESDVFGRCLCSQEVELDFTLDPNEVLHLDALADLKVEKCIPDATVDRITAFARDHFRVGFCLVNLIEADRALVLSRQGIDVSEIPRNLVFCAYTILQDEVLVIPDARADERFKNNPLVTGDPFLRFCAGAPLIYEGEVRLGSLSLLDTKPRSFSRGERAELRMLADHVVSIIISRAMGLPEPDLSTALSM